MARPPKPRPRRKPNRLPPDARLRRRRRRSGWRWLAFVVALVIAVSIDRGGFLLARRGDLGRYDGRSFLVARVIDGDTLEVAAPDLGHATKENLNVPPTTRVRVWGIDTPELARDADPRRPDQPATDAEPFAEQARDLATQLLAGQVVTLHLERSRPRGSFGRVVAHVELPDGGLLAERLLLAGFARADDRWPHRHLERFALLERQARRDGVGLWSGPRDPRAPFSSSNPPRPEAP